MEDAGQQARQRAIESHSHRAFLDERKEMRRDEKREDGGLALSWQPRATANTRLHTRRAAAASSGSPFTRVSQD